MKVLPSSAFVEASLKFLLRPIYVGQQSRACGLHQLGPQQRGGGHGRAQRWRGGELRVQDGDLQRTIQYTTVQYTVHSTGDLQRAPGLERLQLRGQAGGQHALLRAVPAGGPATTSYTYTHTISTTRRYRQALLQLLHCYMT